MSCLNDSVSRLRRSMISLSLQSDTKLAQALATRVATCAFKYALWPKFRPKLCTKARETHLGSPVVVIRKVKRSSRLIRSAHRCGRLPQAAVDCSVRLLTSCADRQQAYLLFFTIERYMLASGAARTSVGAGCLSKKVVASAGLSVRGQCASIYVPRTNSRCNGSRANT